MKWHKFILGNPCGPCEWHIERDVRVFAWFDLIFQAVFVVPVILQFNIFRAEDYGRRHPTKAPTTMSTTTKPGATKPTVTTTLEPECDETLIEIAIWYSVLDIVNLSLGIFSDFLMYIGSKQRRLGINKACVIFFLLVAAIREFLHGTGIYLHVVRCHPDTYGYEIVLRLLCQYMVYGIWIAIEYLGWLHKGQLFVPRRGFMEPKPSVEINLVADPSADSTFLTSSTEFTDYSDAGPSSIMSPIYSSQLGMEQKPAQADFRTASPPSIESPSQAGPLPTSSLRWWQKPEVKANDDKKVEEPVETNKEPEEGKKKRKRSSKRKSGGRKSDGQEMGEGEGGGRGVKFE